MKTGKILTGIFAAALALSFAGCKFNVVSTEVNFDENAHKLTAPTNGALTYASDELSISMDVNGDSGSSPVLNKATEDTKVTIKITSRFKLDKDSLNAGIKFYTCKKNTVFMGCPIRDVELAKVEKAYTEERTGALTAPNAPYTTTLVYNIDTSAVTVNKIAVLFDAQTMKTKQGTTFFNGNNNEIAGEESDSIVRYITVTYKKDTETETDVETTDLTEFDLGFGAMNTYAEEDFAPYISLNLSDSIIVIDEVAKWVFIEDGDMLDYYSDLGRETDSDMKTALDGVYTLQTRSWNAANWTDTPITFTFTESETVLAIDHKYTFITDIPAAGTEYRILYKEDPAVVNTKIAPYYGGHSAKMTYKAKAMTYEFSSPVVSTYYAASPSFVAHFVDYNATVAKEFVKGNISNDDIADYQNDILHVTKELDSTLPYTWEMVPRKEIGATAGFIVVNDKDGKNELVESKTETEVDANGKITKIIVTITDPDFVFADSEAKLYVGSGTTIKENIEYPTEVAFGCMGIRSIKEYNGYVEVKPFFRPGTPVLSGSQTIPDFFDNYHLGNAVFTGATNTVTFNDALCMIGHTWAFPGADFSAIEEIEYNYTGAVTCRVILYCYKDDGTLSNIKLYRQGDGSTSTYKLTFSDFLPGFDYEHVAQIVFVNDYDETGNVVITDINFND